MLNSLETKLVHHSLVYLFLYYFENIFTIKFLQGETKPIEWLKLKPKIKKINSLWTPHFGSCVSHSMASSIFGLKKNDFID